MHQFLSLSFLYTRTLRRFFFSSVLSLLYHAPLNFTLNSSCHGTLTALRILKLLLVREHKWEHPHKNSLPSFSRVYDSYIERFADLCFLNIADILSTTMSLTSIVPVSEVRLNTLYECLPLEPQWRGTKGEKRRMNYIVEFNP